jgi:hypothetical protein
MGPAIDMTITTDTEITMETLYDLLYVRMLDEIAKASSVLIDDDPSWTAIDLSWIEVAQLHIEVVG